MTISLDRLSPTHRRGDSALITIDTYRHDAGEQFELSELEREFPYLVRRIGARGLYLADAAANDAGTFKWRGALNAMHRLQQNGETNVIAPSAGNHLRGAVVAGRILGMTVHGVVPENAPAKKKEGARSLQPDPSRFQLHVHGDTFDESLAWALDNTQLGTVVPPFDHPDVAAGQGTIADDIHAEAKDQGITPRHIVVPVGGGGLFRGIAERMVVLDPTITIHGIEAEGSDSLSLSNQVGRIVPATRPNRKYGGSAVLRTGQGTLDAFQALPNMRLWAATDEEVVAITEDYLESIRDRGLEYLQDFVPFEPTTLVALAGIERIAAEYPNEDIVVVGTGRNDSLDAIWR